ncbi:MAG: hypothetical protein IKX75_04650 [Desulfovibrio sp.]|nr:hypothetical protein [Desulfovibrio sp.]
MDAHGAHVEHEQRRHEAQHPDLEHGPVEAGAEQARGDGRAKGEEKAGYVPGGPAGRKRCALHVRYPWK